ncbi:sec-independent translocase [Streptomyces erythrochromogenes]|uniref:sec-independent translocase n=1 Tax=Streptomyces erythrochromogenes TaxID=285574 RepID=UPI00367690E0
MFDDMSALKLLTIMVLAIVIFGPDKLPKIIQELTGVIQKIRAFSDSAKQDLRSELGPEFVDFEFDDLNPKKFIQKQLAENEDLAELRSSSLDLRNGLNEVTDAVNGKKRAPAPVSSALTAAGGTSPDMVKESAVHERTLYDADAT